MPKKLLQPEQVRDWLVRRFNGHHRAWLDGVGDWPLRVALGTPTEQDVASDLAGVRAWVDAWRTCTLPGTQETEERRWARLGNQTLPSARVVATPADVAIWSGQEQRWRRAVLRHEACCLRWPELRERAGLGRFFDVLADYSDVDFERLLAALEWFVANPSSALYVRQLPLQGVDTKWIEKRTGLVTDFLAFLRGVEGPADFYEATGLSRSPHRLRVRVLCGELRRSVGGLTDIEAPLEQLAQVPLRPMRLLIVENQETGIALPDMPGVVAVVRLGNSVNLLSRLPWFTTSRRSTGGTSTPTAWQSCPELEPCCRVFVRPSWTCRPC